MVIKTLSFDPGEKNFAYSILEHKYSKNRMLSRSVKNGLFESPIKHLNDKEKFKAESIKFHNELGSLLSNSIDIVTVERFMGRGIKIGNLTESANIMIGVVVVKSKKITNTFPQLIPPMTWKNAYNRIVIDDLDACYKICRTSNHQLDASLLGIYSASLFYNITPFSSIKTEKKRDKFLSSIEKTSQTKLIQRREKRKHYN